MSNALAIAAVTAVLKNLLDNALIDDSLSAAVGGPVVVSTLPPDRIKTGDQEIAQLNLFLYNVAPNPGWRNVGLPSRDGNGTRLTNAPLALDLYYLLSVYSKHDLEAEVLLGYAMHLLHEVPVLSRAAIRATLQPTTPVGTDLLPPAFKLLTAVELAEQVELVKIVPQSLSTEEVAKLWTAFQAKYRPSVAYHASVVLIEAKAPTRSPLPVLTRGRADPVTGRDQGVFVQPDLLPPYPTLEDVVPPNKQTAVCLGEVLTLRGHDLDGDTVAARFTHLRSGRRLELPAAAGAGAAAFAVPMPDPDAVGPFLSDAPQNPDNWPAGVYSVAAIVRRAGEDDRHTNEMPLALAPLVRSITPVAAGGIVTLTVVCRPRVAPNQQASVVVGSREVVAEPVAALTDVLTFKAAVATLPAGTQWVRLRIDGVDSILIDRSGPQPKFAASERVTL